MNNTSQIKDKSQERLSGELPVEKGLVSVIIPNWNGKKFLKGCLDSLLESNYPQLQVVIVDNGSKDGSVEFLESNYKQVRLIKFEKNTGFSVAVNAGIRHSNGEFVALLNNDTVVDPSWISEMMRVLKEHPEAGSAACKMVAYDDHSLLDGAGDGYRRGGLPGRIGHRELDSGQFDHERYILGPCGGAALYRRSMLDDIGLFDEDYFAYLEDVDIGLRAQAAGYKCFYTHKAVMYHLGCGTTGSGYHPLVVKLSAQNNLNTIVKNIPIDLLIKFLPQIIYWQAYYFAVVIVRGGQVLPFLHGTWNALCLLPKMLNKRAQINAKRRVPNSYMEEIIVKSEIELAESRQRLINQKQTPAKAGN